MNVVRLKVRTLLGRIVSKRAALHALEQRLLKAEARLAMLEEIIAVSEAKHSEYLGDWEDEAQRLEDAIMHDIDVDAVETVH